MQAKTKTLWTFVITSIALFMVVLDNLVVSTALPVIRTDLDATIEQLEWTVNAYTLTFAVFLLTGAALGDRFGRRRMFILGLGLFTAASAAAALAPSMEALIAARAVQGIGGAIVTPLTLTLLSAAFPSEKRGVALGAWSGIAGLAVAAGPLVGGAVVDGIAWQWIFWLNVPIGLALLPLVAAARRDPRPRHGARPARSRARERRPARPRLGARARQRRRLEQPADRRLARRRCRAPRPPSSPGRRARSEPMLPLRFFKNRAFSAANGASFAMYFGMFGSIFLLSQFFQTAQGYSPFEAGLRVLPWTAMPMVVAPIAGALSDRIGGRPFLAGGLALQAIGLGLDRGRLLGRRRLLVARRPLHRLGDRHGDVLRAGREHRAQRRRPPRRGQGIRRRRTRFARSAASSASRCSRRSSPARAGTSRRRSSPTASSPRRGSAPWSSVSAP